MEDRLDEPSEHRVALRQPVDLHALLRRELPKLLGGRAHVELHAAKQRRRDRRPHVRLAVGSADSGKDDSVGARETPQRFRHQPGLPGTGLAADRDHCAAAARDEAHDRREQISLICPADERDVGARARHRCAAVQPCHSPHHLGLIAATNLEIVDGFAQDLGRGSARRFVADVDPTGRRKRLEPSRDVHDVAHRRVVVGTTDATDDHLAGVDPDPHLDRPPEAILGAECGQRLLHRQRRPNGAVGVVLVGDRRPEQGEDPVAEDLVDAAAIGLDVLDHPLECAVDQPLDPFGVEMLAEPGEPDDVSEEDGDDASLLASRGAHLPATERAEVRSLGELTRTRATLHPRRSYGRHAPTTHWRNSCQARADRCEGRSRRSPKANRRGLRGPNAPPGGRMTRAKTQEQACECRLATRGAEGSRTPGLLDATEAL